MLSDIFHQYHKTAAFIRPTKDYKTVTYTINLISREVMINMSKKKNKQRRIWNVFDMCEANTFGIIYYIFMFLKYKSLANIWKKEAFFQILSICNLTHWGRVTHICVSKLTTIDSDNGLSPKRRQAGILLIGPLGTNFSEILIWIQTFSFKKMHLKMLSAKWHPSCHGLNVLTTHSSIAKPL